MSEEERPLVLVMDDHDSMCDAMRDVLEDEFDVITFSEKMKAFTDTMAYLENGGRRPDSLLLDIIINGEGGLEVATAALESLGYSPAQVVFLTGCHESSPELRSKAYRKLSSRGVRTIIKDTINLEHLKDILRENSRNVGQEAQGSIP